MLQPVLRKLRERAIASMQDLQMRRPMTHSSKPPTNPTREKEDEELAALGGKTRLVPRGSASASSPSNTASPSSSSVSPPPHSVSPPLTAGHLHVQPPSIASQGAIYSRPDQFSHTPPVIANQQTQGWPTYPPASEPAPAYDYNTYTVPPQQWAQQLPPAEEFAYGAAHDGAMSIEMLADQYGVTNFDYSASMPVNSYYGQPGSDAGPMMQSSGEMPTTQDPTAAWQSLVAQFSHV